MGEGEPDQVDGPPGPVVARDETRPVAEQRKRTGVSGGFRKGQIVSLTSGAWPWLGLVLKPGYGKDEWTVMANNGFTWVQQDVYKDFIHPPPPREHPAMQRFLRKLDALRSRLNRRAGGSGTPR